MYAFLAVLVVRALRYSSNKNKRKRTEANAGQGNGVRAVYAGEQYECYEEAKSPRRAGTVAHEHKADAGRESDLGDVAGDGGSR